MCVRKLAVDHAAPTEVGERCGNDRDPEAARDEAHDGLHLDGFLGDMKGDSGAGDDARHDIDRKSTRLNSSHRCISYAVFCLKKKKSKETDVNWDALSSFRSNNDKCNYDTITTTNASG